MKRTLLAALLLVGLMSANVAGAAAYDWNFTVNDEFGQPFGLEVTPQGQEEDVPRILVSDGREDFPRHPLLVATGVGLVWTGNRLDVGLIGQNQVADLESDLTAIDAALAAKAAEGHTHVTGDITGLSGFVSSLIPNQIQSDWATTSTTSIAYIKNKPTVGKVYDGTTQRANAFPLFLTATVADDNSVYYLTSDGTSSGTALCTNGVIMDSLNLQPEEGSAPHAFGTPALTNSNRTLTVPTTKLGTLLGVLALNQSANGSTVRMQIWCY